MSEPKLVIYDNQDQPIAWSKFGVLWGSKSDDRLGEFYGSEIYDNEKEVVARLVKDEVLDPVGNCLGYIIEKNVPGRNTSEFEIIIGGFFVGKCHYEKLLAAAALALLGPVLVKNT